MIGDNEIAAYNVPSRHPVRHAPRGRGQASGRADQGRPRHLRRPRPAGLRHECRARGRADRPQGRVRRRGMAVLPDHRAATSRSSAPPPPTSAATSPTSTRAPISGALDQALAARNNGGIVIAQVKRVAQAGSLQAAARARAGRAGRPHRGRRRTRCRPRRPSTTRPSAARSSRPLAQLPSCTPWGVEKVIARRVALELRARHGGQSRLRHLGQRAAHPARGRPARRGHLGDRAGRGRRRAAARLRSSAARPTPRRSCPRPTSSPTSRAAASTCSLLSFLQIDRDGNVNVSQARRQAAS